MHLIQVLTRRSGLFAYKRVKRQSFGIAKILYNGALLDPCI